MLLISRHVDLVTNKNHSFKFIGIEGIFIPHIECQGCFMYKYIYA